METAVSIAVMMGVGFAAALAQVISDMMEEKAIVRNNEDKARIIMEEYEEYTEGV